MTSAKNKGYLLFYFFLTVIYVFFLLDPIRLTVVDIGRHVANGRELVQGNTQVLYENHYSYVMPQQRFINHHWLFGLISYLLEQTVGFVGLHIFNILVLLASLYLLLKIMEKKSHPFIASTLGLIAVLFLSTRAEIRPESIGLLFITHTLWQLFKSIQENSVSKKQLFLLIIQQLLWVNIHISFVFGFSLIGLLWLCSSLLKNPKLSAPANKRLLLLSLGLIAASFFNPNFVRGFMEPMTILVNYGYSIVENQTLLFLWRVIGHSSYIHFVGFLLGFIPLFLLNFKKLNFFEIALTVLGIILGYSALRNLPLFVMFVMPSTAKLCWIQYQKLSNSLTFDFSPSIATGLIIQLYALLILLAATGVINPSKTLSNRHLGLIPGEAAAANFLEGSNQPVVIFNNYDLGSYLIYHLFPEYKVFTDNRPEAYDHNFFQKVYIPMQQNELVWNELVEQHQINTVVFGINDITPWSIQFVRYIRNQPEWSQVFNDQYVSIWVRDNQEQLAPQES